jgi:hypothetical protein
MGLGRLLVIVLAVTVSMSRECDAQTRNNLLRGVTKIQLLIEELDTQGKECGLTQDSLRTSVLYPLSSAKIEVVSAADVIFYLGVDSLYLKGDQLCFSSINVEAFTLQNVSLFSGEQKQAEIQLWFNGAVASTGADRHARHIQDIIEDKVKKFVTDWNFDNKPETGTGTRGRQ